MAEAVPEGVTLGEVYRALQEIKVKLDTHFVSTEAHQALANRVKFLEKIVFSTIGFIMLAVLSALIAVVLDVKP